MPAGLVGGEDAGEASLLPVDQSGIRLSSRLRLRFDVSDRISAIVHGVSPTSTSLIDIRKHRRMGMMVDYFPASGSGFFLSAGFRRSPARLRWSPGSASNTVQIFAPTRAEPLRVATNVARQSPAMMAGWSGMIGKDATIGFSAGAMQEHARAGKMTSAAIAYATGGTAGWSRVGGLAQVNLAWKF